MRCAHDSRDRDADRPLSGGGVLGRSAAGHRRADRRRARPPHDRANRRTMLAWIAEQGVRFQPSLGGTLSLGRTNSFFLGGGRAMLNALYLTAEASASRSLYDAEVVELDIEDGMFRRRDCRPRRRARRAGPRRATLVAAAGGFEANIEWLKQYWGPPADNFLIRGTPLQPRHGPEDAARQRRSGRSAIRPVPRGRDRRARAEIRRRHHHAARLRRLRHRRQQERRALLRRGRGRLAEALRHLGTARRRAARPDRLHRLRRDLAAPVHAVALSADRRRTSIRELAGKLDARSPTRSRRRSRASTPRCGPAPSTTRSSTIAAPRGSTPPKSHWARRDRDAALLCLSGPARHHLHLSRRRA